MTTRQIQQHPLYHKPRRKIDDTGWVLINEALEAYKTGMEIYEATSEKSLDEYKAGIQVGRCAAFIQALALFYPFPWPPDNENEYNLHNWQYNIEHLYRQLYWDGEGLFVGLPLRKVLGL